MLNVQRSHFWERKEIGEWVQYTYTCFRNLQKTSLAYREHGTCQICPTLPVLKVGCCLIRFSSSKAIRRSLGFVRRSKKMNLFITILYGFLDWKSKEKLLRKGRTKRSKITFIGWVSEWVSERGSEWISEWELFNTKRAIYQLNHG